MIKHILFFIILFLSSTAAAGPENKWYVTDINGTRLILAFEEKTVTVMTADRKSQTVNVIGNTLRYEYIYDYVVIEDKERFVLSNYERDLIYIPRESVIFKALLDY